MVDGADIRVYSSGDKRRQGYRRSGQDCELCFEIVYGGFFFHNPKRSQGISPHHSWYSHLYRRLGDIPDSEQPYRRRSLRYKHHHQVSGLKMGYSYFVINTVLLIISVIIIGPAFSVKTVYAIILASVCLNVFQSIIPETIIQDFALSNGKLMCSIIGGSMAGLEHRNVDFPRRKHGGDGRRRLDHHEIQEYISRTHYPHYGCVHHRFVAVVPVLRC